MPAVSFSATEIRGLAPSLDVRGLDSPVVTDGRNIVLDSDGIRSAFGAELLDSAPVKSTVGTQGVALDIEESNRSIVMFDNWMGEWDGVRGTWIPRAFFTSTVARPHRWTKAFVNGFVFLCHPVVGILWLNAETNEVGQLNVPGLPALPVAIAQNQGRLIVMNDAFLTWSAQSNGFDFTPQIGGPGFQLINDRVPGRPLMIASVARGVLTWTTRGLMFSEFTGALEVYRHRAVNTTFRPVNSFCVQAFSGQQGQQIENDSVVILDRRGLFQTDGGLLRPFAPDFNEFLIERFKRIHFLEFSNLRLEWHEEFQHLYLCESVTDRSDTYTRSWVYYPPLGKWGSFDATHRGLFPVRISRGAMRGNWMAYHAKSDNRLRLLRRVPHVKNIPITLGTNLVRRGWRETAVNGGRSVVTLRMATSAEIESLSSADGYFTHDFAGKAPLEKMSLDATATVGVFKLSAGEVISRLSEIHNVLIGSLTARSDLVPEEDFLVPMEGVEDMDYDVLSGAEDFGVAPYTTVSYSLELLSSFDGMTVATKTTPYLEDFHPTAQLFSAFQPGVWHAFRINATKPGETFQLKWVEFQGILSGRHRS